MASSLSFAFGGDSTARTPEELKRKRQIAEALLQGAVSGTPRNVGEGLSAIGKALGYRRASSANDKSAAAGQESASGAFAPILAALGGGRFPDAPQGGGVPAPTMDYASQRVSQAHGDGDAIRAGLVKRGLPEHIADAFVMNFDDESNLNPGINEAAPTVPGSRGGFGLAQWTGPRRKALEAFAAERGVPASDMDAQLDFLMTELQGPEAKAGQAIMAAPDTGQAAAAIVNQFLRPAEQHRASREARYLNSGGGQASSLTGAPVSPDMPMAGGQPSPQVAQALSQPGRPEMAGNSNTPSLGMLLGAAQNPWLAENPNMSNIIQALTGQRMKEMDPMTGLERRKAELELQALENPPPKPTDDIREYEFAKSQGYQGTFRDFMLESRKAGATNVTVGGESAPGLGKLSTDFGYVLDPATRQPVIDPQTGLPKAAAVPGSPAALEAAAAEQARASQAGQTQTYGNVVIEDIGRVRERIENSPWYSPTTGFFGNILKDVGGTTAADVQELTKGIRANIGFDRLQAMREASPTGGALGQVTERELAFLQATLGSLEQVQSEPQLLENLDRLNEIYTGILRKASAYPNARQFGFEGEAKPDAPKKPLTEMTDEELEAIINGQ